MGFPAVLVRKLYLVNGTKTGRLRRGFGGKKVPHRKPGGGRGCDSGRWGDWLREELNTQNLLCFRHNGFDFAGVFESVVSALDYKQFCAFIIVRER